MQERCRGYADACIKDPPPTSQELRLSVRMALRLQAYVVALGMGVEGATLNTNHFLKRTPRQVCHAIFILLLFFHFHNVP